MFALDLLSALLGASIVVLAVSLAVIAASRPPGAKRLPLVSRPGGQRAIVLPPRRPTPSAVVAGGAVRPSAALPAGPTSGAPGQVADPSDVLRPGQWITGSQALTYAERLAADDPDRVAEVIAWWMQAEVAQRRLEEPDTSSRPD